MIRIKPEILILIVLGLALLGELGLGLYVVIEGDISSCPGITAWSCPQSGSAPSANRTVWMSERSMKNGPSIVDTETTGIRGPGSVSDSASATRQEVSK